MVAQLCDEAGFDHVTTTARDTLTDILQAYIQEVGDSAHKAAELANRTEANAHDVVMALDDSNVSLRQLRDYCERPDSELPLCHEVHRIPVRKRRRPMQQASEKDPSPPHPWLPKLPPSDHWRPSEGEDMVAKLATQDPARGEQIKDAERALINLREAAPSAFGCPSLPKEKVQAQIPPHVSNSNTTKNPYLRAPTITAANDLVHGRNSVRSGVVLVNKAPAAPFAATSAIDQHKVHQILKLEHKDGIEYVNDGTTNITIQQTPTS